MASVHPKVLASEPGELAPSEIRGDRVVQWEVLESLSAAVNLRRWLAELAVAHLGDHPIEIGSGLGDYALEWAQSCARFTATEADPKLLDRLRERLASIPSIEVRPMLLPSNTDAAYSSVVCYNVLEHIEDDVAALESIVHLVRPGGSVVLLVPAFQFALAPVDLATGHVRRYTKRSLSQTLQAAGLVADEVKYVNALGLPCYFLATSIFRLVPRQGSLVRAFDRFVLPLTRAIEHRISLPWGQSVFAVAHVPEEVLSSRP